jgi:hypothetical protein
MLSSVWAILTKLGAREEIIDNAAIGTLILKRQLRPKTEFCKRLKKDHSACSSDQVVSVDYSI